MLNVANTLMDLTFDSDTVQIIDKDLYLNDSLICINKSTLEIDFTGLIHLMKDDEIILKFNNYSRTINPDDYHKFMKRRKGEKNNRKFFEELLKKL